MNPLKIKQIRKGHNLHAGFLVGDSGNLKIFRADILNVGRFDVAVFLTHPQLGNLNVALFNNLLTKITFAPGKSNKLANFPSRAPEVSLGIRLFLYIYNKELYYSF
jgi:hypothetical protein